MGNWPSGLASLLFRTLACPMCLPVMRAHRDGAQTAFAGIESNELHPAGREFVHIRSVDELLPITTEFGGAEVVRHDEDDVWLAGRVRGSRGRQSQEAKSKGGPDEPGGRRERTQLDSFGLRAGSSPDQGPITGYYKPDG